MKRLTLVVVLTASFGVAWAVTASGADNVAGRDSRYDGSPFARAARSSFPCRWNWELATYLRRGYVVAGANANCAGRAGSLAISVELQQRDAQTHVWRTLATSARRFHDLHKSRFVEVAKRCASSAPVPYRAKLSWTLRDTSGHVVSHLRQAPATTIGC